MHRFKRLINKLDKSLLSELSGTLITKDDSDDLINEIRRWSIKRVTLPDGSVALYTYGDIQLIRSFLRHWYVEPLGWFELRSVARPMRAGTWRGRIDGRIVYAHTGPLNKRHGYIVAEASNPDQLSLVIAAVQQPEFSEIGEMTRCE